MKKFFKLSFGILIVIVSLFIAIVFIFSKKFEKFAVRAINEELNAKAEVKNINFTFWNTFPYAAIQFQNVVIHPGNECKNTNAPDVLKAKKIFLYFSWLKLLSAKMEIDKIKIQDAELNLWISNKNEKNFLILKNSESKNKEGINIKRLILKNCKFIYDDSQMKVEMLLLNGVAENKNDNSSWNIKSNSIIERINYSNLVNLKNKKCNIAGKITQEDFQRIKFNDIIFNINDINFFLNGMFSYDEADKFSEVSFNVDTRNASLDDLVSIIPIVSSVKQNGLNSGRFNFKTTIKNIEHKGYEIESKISIEKGVLKKDNVQINKINGSLNFSLNTIENIWRAEDIFFTANTFSGNLSVKGYSRGKEFKSESKFDIYGNHKLEEISPFIEQKYTNVLYGNAEYNVNVFYQKNGNKSSYSYLGKGTIKNFNSITKNNKKVNIDLIQANFNEEGILLNLKNISLDKSNFNLDADVTGLGLYKTKIIAKTKIFGKNIIADELEGLIPVENGKNKKNTEIEFYGDVELSKLSIKNYKLEKVKTQFQYNNQTLFCKSFQALLCDGNIEGKVRIDNVNEKIKKLSGDLQYDKVNINALFAEFNNFGQDFLVADNLKGLVSGKTTFKFDLKPDGKPIEESINAKSKIKIDQGELIKFNTLKQLSRFIEINELENIKFQTLENDIVIHNKQINIPLMKVNSNVLNFNMKGTHTFDQEIDYHFMFLLKDVIAKRFKENNQQSETEFGIIEKTELGTGLPVYVLMTGKSDNPKIRYDHKEGIKRIEFELERETKEIKKILNKDFGLFKNENFETQEEKKENFFEKNSFSIEFDDEQKKDVSKELEKRKKTKSDSKIRKKEIFKERSPKKEETTDDYL